jgi:hypothetical protein
MSEIKLRAIAQIAKLSRELEKAQVERTELPASSGQKSTKEQQIRDAGLRPSTVRRYEQLAAPTEELKPVFEAVTEEYFAEQKNKQELATFEGLDNSPGPGASFLGPEFGVAWRTYWRFTFGSTNTPRSDQLSSCSFILRKFWIVEHFAHTPLGADKVGGKLHHGTFLSEIVYALYMQFLAQKGAKSRDFLRNQQGSIRLVRTC